MTNLLNILVFSFLFSSIHAQNSPGLSQNDSQSTISHLLAKEVIKIKLNSKSIENNKRFETEDAFFEIHTLKDDMVCIVSNFFVDADLAMDALKMQSIKKNPSINPSNVFPVLKQLRVILFELNEENNPQLEPKKIDKHSISRYLINDNHELLIRCITCLSAQQFAQYTKEVQNEAEIQQKNNKHMPKIFEEIQAFDQAIISKVVLNIFKNN